MPLLAISFDWEGLLPILFFVIYAVSQFLDTKKGGEEEEVDPEAEERARRVREEIRRTIEAKRQAAQQEEAPVVRQEAPSSRQPEVAAPRRVSLPPRRSTPDQTLHAPATPQPVAQGPNIHERLENERRRLVEAKKAREEALAKAKSVAQAADRAAAKAALAKTGSAEGLRAEVLSSLSDPLSTRKAILLAEILGSPRGMKQFEGFSSS